MNGPTRQQQMFKLWIHGSMARLTELGLIECKLPQLTEEQWGEYKEIDENRDLIPDIAIEVLLKFLCPDKADIMDIIRILCLYKNQREEIIKYSFGKMMNYI